MSSLQAIPLRNDLSGGNEMYLLLQQQTDGSYLILGVVDPAVPTPYAISLTGLTLSTLGVTDAVDKRFVTDAELAALAAMLPLATVEAQLALVGAKTGCDSLLATNAGVDLNSGTAQTLYTVPTGKSCVISKVVVRNVSVSLTTASVSFGFTTAAWADVIADAVHHELTGATLATILLPMVGAKVGTTGGTFKIKANTLQGAPCTATIDVFGVLF